MNEEKLYNMNFTLAELNVIVECLGNGRYFTVGPIITKISQIVEAVNKPADEAVVAKGSKEE